MHFCMLRFELPTQEQSRDRLGGTIHMRTYGPEPKDRVVSLNEFTANMSAWLKGVAVIYFEYPRRSPLIQQFRTQLIKLPLMVYDRMQSSNLDSLFLYGLSLSAENYSSRDHGDRVTTLRAFDEALQCIRWLEASKDAVIQALGLEYEVWYQHFYKKLLPLLDCHAGANGALSLGGELADLFASMTGLRVSDTGELTEWRFKEDLPHLVDPLFEQGGVPVQGRPLRKLIVAETDSALAPYQHGLPAPDDVLADCERLCEWLPILKPESWADYLAQDVAGRSLEITFTRLKRALVSLVDRDTNETTMGYRRLIVWYAYSMLVRLSDRDPQKLYDNLMKNPSNRVLLQAIWMVHPGLLYTQENIGRYFNVADLIKLIDHFSYESVDMTLTVLYQNPEMLKSIDDVDESQSMHPLVWLLGLFESMKKPSLAPMAVLQRTIENVDATRVTAMLAQLAGEAILLIDEAGIQDEASYLAFTGLVQHVINDMTAFDRIPADVVGHLLSIYEGLDQSAFKARFGVVIAECVTQLSRLMASLPTKHAFYTAMHRLQLITFFDKNPDDFEALRATIWSTWSGIALRNFPSRATLYMGANFTYRGDLEEVANQLMVDVFEPIPEPEPAAKAIALPGSLSPSDDSGVGSADSAESAASGDSSASDDDVVDGEQAKRKADALDDSSDEDDMDPADWRARVGMFARCSKRSRADVATSKGSSASKTADCGLNSVYYE